MAIASKLSISPSATSDETALRGIARRLERQNAALLHLTKHSAFKEGLFENAVRAITETASDIMDVERTSVWLYEENRSRIRCIDLYERAAQRHTEGVELKASDYPSYFSALEENRAIVAHDAHNDSRTREFSASYLTPLNISAMLDAPIRVGGSILGVVCHEQVGPARHWLLEDETFAASIADLVSLAFERSQTREAERALRESQDRYRSLLNEKLEESIQQFLVTFEQAAVGLAHLSPHGQFLRVNEKLRTLLGYTRPQLLERTVSDIVDPEDLPGCLREMGRLQRREIPNFTHETRCRRMDGSRLWGACTLAAVHETNGELKYFIGVFQDITQRKNAEEALRLYREIFLNSIDGIGIIAPDGTYREQNSAHQRMLGYSDAEILGQTPALHMGEEAFSRVAAQLMETGAFRGEINSRCQDGRKIHVELSAFPVYDAKGKPVCYVGFKRDTSERKKMEQKILDQSRMATVGSMAAAVAHELRNPLFGISSAAQVLVRESDSKPGLQELGQSMLSEIARLNRLLDSMLQYSRPCRLEIARVTPQSLVEDVLRLNQATFAQHKIQTRLDVRSHNDGIPVDPGQIRQVTLNLLLNAVQSAPEGSEIEILSRLEGDAPSRWTLAISNHGEMITAKTLAQMFEPFFSTKPDGLGLGLAVSRKIIEDHGGTIRCESDAEHGTRVTVEIPCRD